MEEIILKSLDEDNVWYIHKYTDCQIYTGYNDKNNVQIFSGDTIEYTERDGSKHRAKINFSVERGCWLVWETWHPFRQELSYWFNNHGKYIEIIDEKSGNKSDE